MQKTKNQGGRNNSLAPLKGLKMPFRRTRLPSWRVPLKALLPKGSLFR
jgi:hypothetical protein